MRIERVTDANVVVGAISAHNEEARLLRRRLGGLALAAPHVIDLEVTNSLRRMVRLARTTSSDAAEALRSLTMFGIERHAHGPLLPRCWELRDNVSPYDAAYVALAEALGVPLLTADARLASAPGIRCEVELVT